MPLNQENTKMSAGFNKKFAIIGKGFIYDSHADAIAKMGGQIVDVVDQSGGLGAWKEVVKKTEADCVVILAPNHLHFTMTKLSAENGKMVLCEKPLVLKSAEAGTLAKYPNIFTVYQLRYHPAVKQLKEELKENEKYQVEIDISVHRDEPYWKSWKGADDKSGGILFNLGIHYFDLLLYLFGEAKEIKTSYLDHRHGEGVISGTNYICRWQIRADAEKEKQKRFFKINGKDYNFSSRDNPSFENLHTLVYEDLLKKRGVNPQEAMKSIELIEKIYASKK